MADVVICSTAMPPAKRRRVTVTASVQGVDRAEKALPRLGFGSKSNFAKAKLMGKSTVDRFFNRYPIQLDSFRRICEGLEIKDWKSVAELEPVVNQYVLAHSENVANVLTEAVTNQPKSISLSAARQITVAEWENGKVQFEIVLKGDITSIDDREQKTLETILRSWSGHTITITEIQPGSIRIKIQGSPQDAARLIDRLTSGEVTEINGFPVEDTQILSQDFLAEAEDTEENLPNDKWNLVREIITHPASQRELRDIDLSDADLSGADLSGADLSGADLSDADLSGADLSDADLSGADLSGADLSGKLVNALDRVYAFARDLDCYLTLARDRALKLARARTRTRARTLARYLARYLALTRDLTRDLARDLAIDLNLTIDLNLARDRARALDRALDLASTRARDNALDLAIDLDNARNLALKLALARTRARAGDRQRANISGSIVVNTRFSEGTGFTEAEKLDLKRRGAIFNDSTKVTSKVTQHSNVLVTRVAGTVEQVQYINNLQGANISNFVNQLRDSASQNSFQFSQTIGQNADDIVRLITALREQAQQFPDEQRDDALIGLDDLQQDLSTPEKREPNRIKRRIKALLTIAGAIATPIATATDFANNVFELADKVGIPPSELIQHVPTHLLPSLNQP